ncbi:hypothetical protein MRB53_011132 [Persea americana]|uniref:Uncharacterized protein n=1 Tax=Persea americana TaxID=3435 RepID=A0ACC2LTZ1_PERAE|nr:hypothetical protein MRB53_011132 [Persea americana]
MDKISQDCPYPGCFFCVMKEGNPSKRRASILKFFRELPSQDDDGQVIDKAVTALIDLAEISTLGDHKKLGDTIVSVLQECLQSQGTGRNSPSTHTREQIEELLNSRQRLKWEKAMPKEDLHIKQAAALMRAAWLFREAAVKHGGVHCDGGAGDLYGQEGDDSEWETASESDIGNDGRGDMGDDDSEWKNDDDRKDKYEKPSIKDIKHAYNVQLAEDET